MKVYTFSVARVATSSNEKSGTLDVWGLSPQLGPGTELLVGIRWAKPPPPSENGGLGRSPQKLSTFACVEDHWHCIF